MPEKKTVTLTEHLSGGWPMARTFGEVYQDALELIFDFGVESSPRGIKTKEVLGAQVMLLDARQNLLDSKIRNLNYRFSIAEWVWIVAGRNDVASIARYNSEIAKFSDDGVIFAGAYGPRLQPQWTYIIDKLKKDHDTRQAVVSVWTPSPGWTKDVPCTIAMQFLLRGGAIHAVVTMRSSDAWLGLPYDIFNFTMIQNWLAGYIGAEVGTMTMQLGSLHLYETNWDAAHQMLLEKEATITSPRLPKFEPEWFKMLFDGSMPPQPEPWGSYQKVLHEVKNRKEARDVLVALAKSSVA